MAAARPGPTPKVITLPRRGTTPVMPAGLTELQQATWREVAANPFLTEADYPLLDEFVELMKIRDRALEHVRTFGSTIANNRGNQLMNPEYKVYREMNEALMKLRERMLLTPQSRLKAGRVDDSSGEDEDLLD
jgi:P27 family predicted phage terminase small subunit